MLVIMSERALVGSEGALVGLLVCEGALVGFIIPLLDVTELHLSIDMQKSTTRLSVYNNNYAELPWFCSWVHLHSKFYASRIHVLIVFRVVMTLPV